MENSQFDKGQLIRAFLPLGLVFGLKKLPFDDAQLLIFARGVFSFRILVTIIVVALTTLRMRSMADAEKKKIVKAHEKNLGVGQTEVVVDKTVEIYDRDSLMEFTKQQMIQIAFIAFLHFKFELVQPLILSSVLGLIAFPEQHIFQIHLLKKVVARPFPHKAPAGLMGMFGGDTPAAPLAPAAAAAPAKKDKKNE
jgi:hypothetical protein